MPLATDAATSYCFLMLGTEPGDEHLSHGWSALSKGLWDQARAAFEKELETRESPEALEGLSWAAWWLDDAHTVFEARERAYQLYKAARDHASASRMATWLAGDYLDFHGSPAVARGWLRRSARMLEPLDPGPDHGWHAFHEGYIAHISGDTARAAELGARAAEIGRQFDVPDLEMLGLGLQGATLVACARVEDGMRLLDEATATALSSEANVPISSAWTCCFLVSACTAVFDFERASEWCDRIAEFADRYGSRFMLAFCRAEYGAVHTWRGRWADAEMLLESSIDDFANSRPAWAGGPLVALAELRRRQGRAGEVEQLLSGAGHSLASELCRARLALDQGDSLRACELGEKLLRRLPEERKLERAPVLALLISARAGRAELEAATAHLDALREIDRLIGTAPLKASTDWAAGIVTAAAGDHESARPFLEDALDSFERSGARFESAVVRIDLASSLVALGRTKTAEREARAAHDRLVELGAAAQAQRALGVLSVTSRGSRGPEITPREHEVLRYIAKGLTNRQIAERLVVSEHTVHRHVTNILRKLELPSRTAAAAYAERRGLVDADV